mgnify:CR=1 FL=1
MPPQHGKSLHASILFPAYCLGRNPRRKIIMSSYSGNIAARFGREVRNLCSSPTYKSLFPKAQLSEDSQAKNKFDTTEGGYYIAAGREGSITSYGADIMILDDLFSNRLEAESTIIRDSVWDVYTSVYRTRMHAQSSIVMLMTRWHEDDLIGRVLASEEGWDVLELPALAVESDEYRREGEALWPDRFPTSYLTEIKKQSPDLFQCMYQCRPIDLANAKFKREWIKTWDADLLPSGLNYYITVDLASSMRDGADDTVVMVTAMGHDRSVYVIEYTAAHLDPSETIEEIFRLASIYRPVAVGVETVAYQSALKHFLEKEMVARYRVQKIQPLNIVPIKTPTDRSKQDKILNTLLPFIKNGLVKTAPNGMDKLLNQLLSFPKGAHDDVIDALAMAADLWQVPQLNLLANIQKPIKADKAEKDLVKAMRQKLLHK